MTVSRVHAVSKGRCSKGENHVRRDESKAQGSAAREKAQTSNPLSWRELWSLFQAMKAEAKNLHTGGFMLVPEMQGKRRQQGWEFGPHEFKKRCGL
jgi:hypothetical protein